MNQETLCVGSNTLPVIKVHPSVIFEILNSFTRRNDSNGRVVGTLLGIRKENGIEITECFVVPHDVSIKKEYHYKMINFRKQINKRELVVGWFSTSSSTSTSPVSDACSIIHHFYANECNDPVLLVVDTLFRETKDHLNIKAFMSKPLMVGNFSLANIFQPLNVTVDMSIEAEVLCLHEMINGQAGGKWSNTTTKSNIVELEQSYAAACESLSSTIKNAITHVEKLNENDAKCVQINLAISDALTTLRSVKKDDFDAIYQNKADGLLMISYITALTKTQLIVSEKLNAVL